MKAVIIATGEHSNLMPLDRSWPAPLVPVMDRPFIQHIVEMAVDLGIQEISLILSHLPEKIESYLGDGLRWGVRIHYHLTRDPVFAYQTIASMQTIQYRKEGFLLGHADRLPDLRTVRLSDEDQNDHLSVFCKKSPAFLWTGWAWIPKGFDLDWNQALNEQMLGEHLIKCANTRYGGVVDIDRILSIQSFEDLTEANRQVLDKSYTGLLFSGREIEPSVWVCRNVSLHPTAKIKPPVYIGENSQIGMGTELGPYAVISHGSMLDRHCMVSNSLIFPGSYVGESLELSDVIIDKNRLINTRLEASTIVRDDFIISSMSAKGLLRTPVSLFARFCALIALIILLPVILLTALILKIFRKGPVFYKKTVVRIPTTDDQADWTYFDLWSFTDKALDYEVFHSRFKDLFLRVLPALIHIARGELAMVGVRPRTVETLEALPSDWKALYVKAKPGCVTEAWVHYGSNPKDDERYSAEAFYAVNGQFRHNIKILVKYILWLFHLYSPGNNADVMTDEEDD
ncbi:MAG: sugar transferase [Candidatus Omnitrophica bacterium]|nr:sugar transferase [Candidatus Omnitrophota bacterium]